jgi:PA14 domain
VKRFDILWLLVGVLVVLLFVLVFLFFRVLTPAQPATTQTPAVTTTSVPTQSETPELPTATPNVTPGVTASPQTEASPTATPSSTPTASPTATQVPASPTATQVPASPTATQVPASPTPTRTPVPPTATAVTITDWKGEYYDNISLQAPPKVVRNDLVVDLTLPKGKAPAPGMPSENWSARWTRGWNFAEGNYRFHLVVDDGGRLWVGGHFLIDAWTDGGPREYVADLYLKGDTPIKLEYYNHLGDARVRLNWEPITQFPEWKGSYFANINLSGLPLFQRNDATIDFNWASGSPRADMPVDNFSIRWTRRLNFSQAGLYRFRILSDDGVRVWVGGTLVIDQWIDGSRTYEGQKQLFAGQTEVRVEYYEHTGGAAIKLTWELVPGLTATPTRTSTAAPPTATPTSTAVPASATPTATAISPSATPTATTVPPSATPTSTAAPPTATPTPIPPTVIVVSPTPIPPTQTPIPPVTPPLPGKPSISLEPAAGPIGQPFTVLGRQWPPNVTVELFLAQSGAQVLRTGAAGQVVTDPNGNFSAPLIVPAGEGWEGKESAKVVAVSSDNKYSAQATYKLLPELKKVTFTPIQSVEARVTPQGPTYLVLGSAEEWAAWFRPVEPPVNWQSEIVIGAFVASPSGGVRVSSIVMRNTTVSTWLSIPISSAAQPSQTGANMAWVLVRVPRQLIQPDPAISPPAGLTFAFLDAVGRLLAQGPAGVVPPVSALPKAAAPVEQLLAASPAGATQEAGVQQQAQPAEPFVEVLPAATAAMAAMEEPSAATGLGAAEPAATVEPAASAKPSTGLVVAGVLLATGVVALAGLGLYSTRRRDS